MKVGDLVEGWMPVERMGIGIIDKLEHPDYDGSLSVRVVWLDLDWVPCWMDPRYLEALCK